MTPAVEVTDLHFQYPGAGAGSGPGAGSGGGGGGVDALRGVTFSIAPGECVAIIGPNGSGKSTLLLHLNGLLPDEREPAGNVRIDGAAITRATLRQVRRQVGLLFQDPDDQLFCPTVFDDIAFGPRQFGVDEREIAARVNDALARVGLTNVAQRPPHRLSGGEKRRACLAGVLACEPAILVLDEPSSGLDPRGRREAMQLLRSIPATKLIATHDLELVVELCPRVILLDQGRVIADGPTTTLLADEPLMLAHGLERPHILTHRHPHRE